jgi:enterochelin esterase-like enzyme
MRYFFLVTLVCLLSCKTSPSKKDIDSVVITGTFYSKHLDRDLAFRTYLPENYNESEVFHVIYLLHGHGGSDDDWFSDHEGHVKTVLDSLYKINRIPAMVAVTMDAGNSWYIDSKERMESAYVHDFIPFAETTYNVESGARSRIIAGNSAGGYGALRLSLKYPELFKASILLSPAAYSPLPPKISSSRKTSAFEIDGVFNDSIWLSNSYHNLINTERDLNLIPRFYLSTGDDDNYDIFAVVNTLRTFFREFDLDNEIVVTNGGHSWDVWRRSFARDLARIVNDYEL